jgi:hypothetical protein
MKTVFLITGFLLFPALLVQAATRECGQSELSLPAEIDVAAEPPCSEAWSSSSGPSSVGKTALGAYRVLGGQYLDRMAYLFRTESAGDFIRLTVAYPDDVPRNAEIYCFSEADPSHDMIHFGTGYFTGDPYPITHRMIQQAFYFFAPSQKFAIVFMTAAPGRPAALARMRVEKVDIATAVKGQPAVVRKSDRRKLGMYWEDEVFQQNFGELSVPRMTAAQQAAAFQRALDCHVAYMKLIGHNLVIDPVVWYDSALYQPSAEYHPSRMTDQGTLRPPDFDRWMAKRYSEAGFDFWPSIRNWSLPSLVDWVKSADDVRSGGATEYVNTVDKNGRVVTRSAWHNPPMMNALHPRVQGAMKNLVTEIMDRLAPYESVKGIVLWATIHSIQGLGTPDQSYDDYTVRTFASDEGLRLPPPPSPPEGRFRQWCQWLHSQHWNAWIAWRKKKVTELYDAMADIVARKKPGAKLNVMVLYPSPTMNVGKTVDDVQAYLDSVGLDIDALARNPNIIISRLTLAHEYQHQLVKRTASSPGMPELLQRAALDFSPAWQKPFLGKTAGAVVQYTYFEHNLAHSERLHPVGWRAGEPGWHVTSPKAAGYNALEYLARSIALYDPQFIAYGGFQLGPQGMEETVGPFAAAFTSLPAVPFLTLSDQNGVVVRGASAEGCRWLYAVNATPEQRTVDLTSAGGPKSAALPPWGLAVFRLGEGGRDSSAIGSPKAQE